MPEIEPVKTVYPDMEYSEKKSHEIEHFETIETDGILGTGGNQRVCAIHTVYMNGSSYYTKSSLNRFS